MGFLHFFPQKCRSHIVPDLVPCTPYLQDDEIPFFSSSRSHVSHGFMRNWYPCNGESLESLDGSACRHVLGLDLAPSDLGRPDAHPVRGASLPVLQGELRPGGLVLTAASPPLRGPPGPSGGAVAPPLRGHPLLGGLRPPLFAPPLLVASATASARSGLGPHAALRLRRP